VSASSSSTAAFETLDDCINQSCESETMSLANLIRGRPIECPKTADLQPITFMGFNTSLGKPEPVTLKALLDSGGSESHVTEKFVKKLRLKKSSNFSTEWTTPGGEMRTNQMVKAQFTMPELHEDRLIEWNLHVTKALGKYNMIIGRDILQFLKIDLRFSDNKVKWDGSELPFKDGEATPKEAYHIAEGDVMDDAVSHIKIILDAEHQKADLKNVCQSQTELTVEQKGQLEALLCKYEPLFEGQLGRWQSQEVKLELKEGAKPYHSRAYNIPRCHIQTLKAEVEHVCQNSCTEESQLP